MARRRRNGNGEGSGYGVKRPAKEPQPPAKDVQRKQDPDHTVDDFLRDLAKVTRREPSEPPQPDQESSRTSDRD